MSEKRYTVIFGVRHMQLPAKSHLDAVRATLKGARTLYRHLYLNNRKISAVEIESGDTRYYTINDKSRIERLL